MKKHLILFCIILGGIWHLSAQTEFALLTDLHVSPGNPNERALAKIIEEINTEKVPFVIITGDLTNQGSNEELATVKRLFDRFTMPYYVLPGNHETNWSQSAVKEFYRLFGNDRFCFRSGNTLLVGFNTGPYMKMGDGLVKQEDLRWLDDTLSKEASPQVRVFSFAHYPLMENDLSNADEVISLLEKYHTVASFCGHGHQYKEMLFGRFKGIMARSLFMGKDTVAGYTLVRLTPDSVYVNEKRAGQSPRRCFSFSAVKSVSPPLYPQKPLEKDSLLPAGFRLSLIYQDDASIFSGVAADQKAIYFVNSMGEVKAISKKNTRLLWKVSTGYTLYATPLCAENKLVVPATDGHIYAFSTREGRKCWQVTDSFPFVADGRISERKLYQGGYKKFYKIDLHSGKIEWVSHLMNNYCQAQPAVTKSQVIFGAWDTYLYSLDTKTGALLWKWNNGIRQNLFSPANCVPVVTGDKVIIVAPDRYMTALNLSDGKVLWRSNKFQVRESQGISQDGKTVYAKLMNGSLLGVSAESAGFEPVDTVDLGIGYEHAPCPILEKEGIVYLGTRDGVVVAVDANSYQVLWRRRCGNSGVNRFFQDTDGSVFFSLMEGKILRLEVPRKN